MSEYSKIRKRGIESLILGRVALIEMKSPNDLDTCHVKWVPRTMFWYNEPNQTLGPF